MRAGKDRAGLAEARRSSSNLLLRSPQAVVWLAVLVRLALFPLAENKHADAPIRALIAERMNADPAAAVDPRSFCQFGPLPIELIRAALFVDPDARRSSRLVSLVAGIVAFIPFFALSRRMIGASPATVLAGLALALSPLHIQVSTTAASEALYVLLFLAALERLHAAVANRRRRDFVIAGLLASLAGVTRYDSWIAIPAAAVAALIFGRRDLRALIDAGLFLIASALVPGAYLGWSWAKSGDPFFFARYITQDHVAMAHSVTVRLGPALARVRQVGVWILSFAAAMTPVAFLSMGWAARTWRGWPAATRVVVASALAPTAAYLAKGLLFGSFEPLPRFAVVPGVVLLPLAAAALVSLETRWRWVRPAPLVVGGAVALSLVVLVLAFDRPGRIWTGAESLGPVTRLDAEDRALAQYLARNRRPEEGVFIDTLGFADIAVAHAARIPAPRVATLSQTRDPGRTLAESRRATDASWFAVHDDSWGRLAMPDWPTTGRRFGHWSLVHVGDRP